MQLPIDYAPAKDLLAGQVILVTGAGNGIGRAVSRILAEHGATIILVGRTMRHLKSAYDEIIDVGAVEPIIFGLDLLGAQPQHYDQLADGVRSEFGRLDGVLHNAGILGMLSTIEHQDPEQWAKVMQVNTTAAYLLTRALLPLLRQGNDSRILFSSSGVGRRGRAHWGAYAVSKFALEGLMQVVADEVENDGVVRVASINPGATRTNMRAAAFPAEYSGKLRAPADIAPAYLYFFGPEGRALHGLALNVQ